MQNHTTASIAGKTISQTDREEELRDRKFHEHCPLADAYLRKAQTGTPVRPEQHRLVMRWPMFDCIEELQAEHWEFGGPTLLPGLLLHGASGTGKTTSAYLAIRESLESWRSFQKGIPDVIAVRAVEMGRNISELSRTGGDEFQDFLTGLACTGLLFIDDLDKARFTPRVESEIFDLLEYREKQELAVVVTTNLKGRELEKMFSRHVGSAIVNRLRRMCVPIDFDHAGFDQAAALAAIQEKIRHDFLTEANANRAWHLGQADTASP